jgi:hypothetical protein
MLTSIQSLDFQNRAKFISSKITYWILVQDYKRVKFKFVLPRKVQSHFLIEFNSAFLWGFPF